MRIVAQNDPAGKYCPTDIPFLSTVQGSISFVRHGLFFLLPLLLVACAGPQQRRDTAEALAASAGFSRQVVDTGRFRLTLYYRVPQQAGQPLAVYVEGDGHAWKQKHRLSDDPTPMHPVSLQLAARDPGAAVLYIARPCQYLTREELRSCDKKYWSSHRYAEEVVESVNAAVDWGVLKTGAAGIYLYGYSGGGAVAALVAARRGDVRGLTTIAANLDHALWTSLHGISPLSGSLNPADETSKLRDLPQVHFAGSADRVVPVRILEAYLARYGDKKNISLQVVPGFDHHCCWADSWPELLSTARRDAAP